MMVVVPRSFVVSWMMFMAAQLQRLRMALVHAGSLDKSGGNGDFCRAQDDAGLDRPERLIYSKTRDRPRADQSGWLRIVNGQA